MKKEFDRLLSDVFNNDRNLKHCFHSNFEQFLNISQKAAEFLFLYIDDKLKKGLQADVCTYLGFDSIIGFKFKRDEEEVEVVLDEAIELFPFLQQKDVFEKCYRQHLAKRILQPKNLSDDAYKAIEDCDKYVISKLKAECGCQFTSKLEGMIRDTEIYRTLMDEYREREAVCFWPMFNSLVYTE